MELSPNDVHWVDEPISLLQDLVSRNSHLYARENYGERSLLTWDSVHNVGHQIDEWTEVGGLILNGRRGQVAGNDHITGVQFMGAQGTTSARLNFHDVRTVLCETGWDMMNTQYNRLNNLEAALCKYGFRFWNHPRWGGATDQPAQQIKPHQCEYGLLFLDLSRGDLGYGLPMNGSVWQNVFPRENHHNHFVFDAVDSLTGGTFIISGGSSEYLQGGEIGAVTNHKFVVPERGEIEFNWKRGPAYVGTALVYFDHYHFNDNQPVGTHVILLDKPASRLVLEHSHGGGPDSYFVKQDHPEAKASYYGEVFTYGVMEGLHRFPDGWIPFQYGDDKSACFVGPDTRQPAADRWIDSLLHVNWTPSKPYFVADGSYLVSNWLRGYTTEATPITKRPTPTVFNLWLKNNGSPRRIKFWLETSGGRKYGPGENTPIHLNSGWNRVCIVHNGNRWGDVPDMRVRMENGNFSFGEIAYSTGNERSLSAAIQGKRGE